MLKKLVLVFFPAVVLALAADASVSFISDPDAIQVPADPNAPLCVEVPVDPTDAPPPFGTVVQQWNLAMSKTYAGSGITWVRSQGRFYLMDQGLKMWSFDPLDPVGTMRDENWVFPNFGTPTPDVTWGLAWDDDSSCFWVTQVLDGNIYAGCYLLRLSPQGTWYGTTRDSWCIGNGSAGGGLQMYWGAGMEKWIDRGFFCIAPVAPSPSANNYVCKFDPYTKTNLGRVTYGDQTSERGCALIPYDSLYILTCGWNANQLRKRREDGFALQSVTASGSADCAMWVPRNIVWSDTVYVFLMTSTPTNTLRKISCGFTWGQLPSVEYMNVAPTEILAPVGEVDSGMTVVPRVVVANRGPGTVDSFDVYMKIGPDYESRKVVRYLSGGRNTTVSFDPWVVRERESLDVTAFTWWRNDQDSADDTIQSRILARVRNVAVTEIVAPVDTLDSAAVVVPLCRVQNQGNLSETFDVRFKIGLYENTVSVSGLAPGSFRQVQAGEPYLAKSGMWLHRVEALLDGDLRPDNNTMLDTFWVRGTPSTDVAAEAILSPSGRLQPRIRVRPSARVANYGGKRESFSVFFSVWDTVTDRLVYHKEAGVSLGAGGAATTVNFPETSFVVHGLHVSRCSVYAAGDGNMTNDAVRGQFRIDPTVYQHNVMVQAITVPVGNVDSASTVTPTVLVTNTGLSSETFTAHFVAPGGYSATVNVYDLPAESTRTLRFPVWNVASPRGNQPVKAWTYLIGDQYRADDTVTAQVSVRVRDAGAVSIAYPVDTVPDGITLRPRCVVRNFGTNSISFDVEFRIGVWADTAPVALLDPGQSATVEMRKLFSTNPGMWLSTARTLLTDDRVPANNACYDTFWVPGVIRHDVGVEAILAPADTIDTLTNVTPKARVANYSLATQTWRVFFKVYGAQGAIVYSESLLGVSLPAQTSKVLEFPQVRFPDPGAYTGRCSSHLATDQNWTNNVVARQFYVATAGGWEQGYREMNSVPLGAGRPVKDGGFMVVDQDGRVFVGKGYKTGEFYMYSPASNRWTTLCSIPWFGPEGVKPKPPGKGAAAVSDGVNKIYLVMGNGLQGFAEYDVGANQWTMLPDVPLGVGSSKRRVKAGTAVEYVEKNDTGFVYLLKGNTVEFYRYNTITKWWDTMPAAPYGVRPKYPAGSWLCEVPSGVTPHWYLYAHQSLYNSDGRHQLFSYDLHTDTWNRVSLRGMPLAGLSGGSTKEKKSGDGGAAAEYGGYIYALKGGNTQGLYMYSPVENEWTELETIPRSGSGGRKCVKGGADIIAHPAGAFFILKGNKTTELWRYVRRTAFASGPAQYEGPQSGKSEVGSLQFVVSPNPMASGFATLRLASGTVPALFGRNPGQSPALLLRIYDATGRCVLGRSIADSQSPVTLDLRKVPEGVYLVRLEAAGYSQTQKLVVQR